MDETIYTKLTITALLSTITIAFQWYLPILIIFIGAIIIDYLTGMSKAFLKGEINSKTGFKGIIKKLLYFAVVACGFMIDFLLSYGLSYAGIEVPPAASVGAITTVLLILNEITSIIENLGEIDGVPIPKILKSSIQKLKDLTDKTE